MMDTTVPACCVDVRFKFKTPDCDSMPHSLSAILVPTTNARSTLNVQVSPSPGSRLRLSGSPSQENSSWLVDAFAAD